MCHMDVSDLWYTIRFSSWSHLLPSRSSRFDSAHRWSEGVIKCGTLTKYRKADVMPAPVGMWASCDWVLRSNAALLAENSERGICRLLHFCHCDGFSEVWIPGSLLWEAVIHHLTQWQRSTVSDARCHRIVRRSVFNVCAMRRYVTWSVLWVLNILLGSTFAFSALCLFAVIILTADTHRPCVCVSVRQLVCTWMVSSLKNSAVCWSDARQSDSPSLPLNTHTHSEMHRRTQQRQTCNPTPDEWACVCVC